MSTVWPYFAAIVPTILVATLFYFLIKSMLEGDRRERLAQSRFEAEEDRRRADADSQPGVGQPEEGHSAADSPTTAQGPVDRDGESPPT